MPTKILVVDDDRALQVLMNILLTRAGFECDCVNDGEEALQRLDGDGGEKYSVVMVDLILPGMDGAALLNRMRELHPALMPHTIIVTSASARLLNGLDTSDVHAVIHKPFDIQEVLHLTTQCAYRE